LGLRRSFKFLIFNSNRPLSIKGVFTHFLRKKGALMFN
jgi:hypothetical protein